MVFRMRRSTVPCTRSVGFPMTVFKRLARVLWAVEGSSARVLRCSGAQVLRCSGAWVLRCSGARVLRCSGARVLGCSGAGEVVRCRPEVVVNHPARAGLAILMLTGALGAPLGLGAQPASRRAGLFKDSRAVMALARARGIREVSALVASRPGQQQAVVRAAERVAGNVRYRDDEVGYLRVRVPIDRVNEFAAADGIEALTLEIDDLPPGGPPS